MELFIFIILGFLAEMIDGTAGMAYGVSSNTFLRTAGVPSAVSSACVHAAEMFTTLASGIAHWRMGNVDKRLFKMLLIAGIPGGILGAWLLASFESLVLDIIIDVYLIVMGLVILVKGIRMKRTQRDFGPYAYPLGFVGGFTDALGGGGWGPVVTSTLLASDHEPRVSIGTVNTAEFFVTVAETTTFLIMLNSFMQYWTIVIGLIIGGVIAAPLAARLTKVLPIRGILLFVGILVIVLNTYKLIGALGVI
ncbi:MAG: sulfite exporter TauE/SafE family protein [Atopobiaceae bacterium]|nr:sulfite exporter TauE/SafE family protein [Atopobiaceae bacterium]